MRFGPEGLQKGTLELLTLPEMRVVKNAPWSSQGQFSFGDVPEGKYVIRTSGDTGESTDLIPILLSRASGYREFDIGLSLSTVDSVLTE
jgi:hypothetical protein